MCARQLAVLPVAHHPPSTAAQRALAHLRVVTPLQGCVRLAEGSEVCIRPRERAPRAASEAATAPPTPLRLRVMQVCDSRCPPLAVLVAPEALPYLAGARGMHAVPAVQECLFTDCAPVVRDGSAGVLRLDEAEGAVGETNAADGRRTEGPADPDSGSASSAVSAAGAGDGTGDGEQRSTARELRWAGVVVRVIAADWVPDGSIAVPRALCVGAQLPACARVLLARAAHAPCPPPERIQLALLVPSHAPAALTAPFECGPEELEEDLPPFPVQPSAHPRAKELYTAARACLTVLAAAAPEGSICVGDGAAMQLLLEGNNLVVQLRLCGAQTGASAAPQLPRHCMLGQRALDVALRAGQEDEAGAVPVVALVDRVADGQVRCDVQR